MIGDLLDANSVIAGKRLALRIGTCDLSAIAREVIEQLSAAHGRRFVLEAVEAFAEDLERHVGASAREVEAV